MKLVDAFAGGHLLVFLVLPNLVASDSMCEMVAEGKHRIQGVAFPSESKGLLFVNDRVFEFNPANDFTVVSKHSLYIHESGLHVEKYFPGVFLNDNHIFNVFGFFNNQTSELDFILSNDNAENAGFSFKYDFNRKVSIELTTPVVSPVFPFLFFSDNKASIFLYQVPMYSFYGKSPAQFDKADVDSVGFFGFNTLDRQMDYIKVDGLKKLDQVARQVAVLRTKVLLQTAFMYREHVYLMSRSAVYIIPAEQMRKNPLPEFTKVKLADFLKCDPGAKMDQFNLIDLAIYILSIILVILLLIVCYLFLKPDVEDAETATQGSPHSKKSRSKSKGSKSKGSKKSARSSATPGQASTTPA